MASSQWISIKFFFSYSKLIHKSSWNFIIFQHYSPHYMKWLDFPMTKGNSWHMDAVLKDIRLGWGHYMGETEERREALTQGQVKLPPLPHTGPHLGWGSLTLPRNIRWPPMGANCDTSTMRVNFFLLWEAAYCLH